MKKKYWNKGAFMTDLNEMIVADEQHLDQIENLGLRESIRKQLEVRLPVHPDILIRVGMYCGYALSLETPLWSNYYKVLFHTLPYFLLLLNHAITNWKKQNSPHCVT